MSGENEESTLPTSEPPVLNGGAEEQTQSKRRREDSDQDDSESVDTAKKTKQEQENSHTEDNGKEDGLKRSESESESAEGPAVTTTAAASSDVAASQESQQQLRPAAALSEAYPVASMYAAYASAAAASHEATVPSVLSPTGDSEVIEVSQDKVGQIIGSKGAIIQDMQMRTGAKIFVNQNFPDGVNRQVNITGTPQQVKAAGDLVRRIITEGPTAIHVNSMMGGPTVSVTMDCPQPLVGRVIGSSGATIKELQSRSGAKIQIDQNFPDGVPRKISLSGTQTAVNLGIQLVTYVMENGPTLPGSQPSPMGGGGGGGFYGAPSSMGGMQMGGGFGGVMGGGAGSNTTVIECQKQIVGRIIGRGGETINMLQTKSGTKIQVDQNVPVGTPCKVMVTGSPQCIAVATQLIHELMMTSSTGGARGGAGPMGGGMGMYGVAPQQQGFGGGYPPQQFGGMGAAAGMMAPAFGGYAAAAAQQQMQQFQLQQQQFAQQQHAYGGGVPGMGGAGGGYPQQQQQQQTSYPAAAPTIKPAATSVWSEHKTDDGNTYWYNSSSGVSQWERPAGM